MRKEMWVLTGLLLALAAFGNGVWVGVAAAQNDEARKYFSKAYNTQNTDVQITNYRKAIELDPNYTAAYINLGAVYIETKRYEEAIPVLEKAFELDPQHPMTIQNLSTAYNNFAVKLYNSGEKRNAWETFTKAAAINPNDQVAKNNLRTLFQDGPPVETNRIKEMVLRAIQIWQNRAGQTVSGSEQNRIVNEYLAAVKDCGAAYGSAQPEKIEPLVSRYLDYLFQGKQLRFIVCDPLR